MSGVVTFDTVTPERVAWLWPGRIPAGKLVVLDGDPSVGKSTLTVDLAARVSNGTAWPDGAACRPGDVLLLSAEDGLADTIAPRLAAAGADLRGVHALTEVEIFDEAGNPQLVPPSIPRDLDRIKAVIVEKSVRLVVIDVLMAYLNGTVDSHRDQDVRGVLHRLARIAEDTGATILLVRHLNKAGGTNALYRGGGSIGIVGAARAAYLVARDPDDPERRILAVTKSNLAKEPPALAYRLIDAPDYGCARVEWETGPVDVTAAELLRSPGDDEQGDTVTWLIELLTERGGSVPASDVQAAAKSDGLVWRTVQRATKRAGITIKRQGFGAGSVWSLDTIHDTFAPFASTKSGVTNGANDDENGLPAGQIADMIASWQVTE